MLHLSGVLGHSSYIIIHNTKKEPFTIRKTPWRSAARVVSRSNDNFFVSRQPCQKQIKRPVQKRLAVLKDPKLSPLVRAIKKRGFNPFRPAGLPSLPSLEPPTPRPGKRSCPPTSGATFMTDCKPLTTKAANRLAQFHIPYMSVNLGPD